MLLTNKYISMAEGPVEHTATGAETSVPTETHVGIFQSIYQSNVINFFIVIVFLIWVVRKTKLFEAVDLRKDTIKKSIREAEDKKVKAELELDAVEKKLRRSEDETAKILANGKQVSESLADRILKETEVGVDAVIARSQKAIEADKEMANARITKQVTDAAFEVASHHIKQSIDDNMHKKFIDEFIDNLPDLKV